MTNNSIPLILFAAATMLMLPKIALAQHEDKDQFIDIQTVLSTLKYDIKYYSNDNFVGTRINGYQAEKCFIDKRAIADLKKHPTL